MLNVHRTTSPRMFAVVELTAYLRLAVAALLVIAAAMLVSRRLAGALATPLGPLQLLVTGMLLAGLARIAQAPAQTRRFRAGNILISLAMFVIATSLSLSGSNSVALLGFWAVIAGEEILVWRNLLPVTPQPPEPAGGDLIGEPEPVEPATDVLQQLTLRTTAEGGQELSGWLRMPLAAGQRSGSLHVAFCPSFGQTPQVQTEAVSGPDCRIKTAQVLPYGARLDVKLDEPAGTDDNVLVWFFACGGA